MAAGWALSDRFSYARGQACADETLSEGEA